MKQVEIQIDRVTRNLSVMRRFADNYPSIFSDYASFDNVDNDQVRFAVHDASLAGKLFGTDGWTSKVQRYSGHEYKISFDWEKNVDGVLVVIVGASEMDMAPAPVSPKQFPLMLEDERQAVVVNDGIYF